MKLAWLSIPVVVLLSSSLARTAETPEAAATREARAWLSVVDSGKYEDSWDAAAKLFKDAVTREAWSHAVAAVRGPLGKVVARNLTSAKFTTTLPGAPDGQYVVIRFATSFAQKKKAVETITPMQEPDGSWKVSGYFVK